MVLKICERAEEAGFHPDRRNGKEGLHLLQCFDNEAAAVFFDPQYRTILDKMQYGNEGKSRGRRQARLKAMPEATIKAFVADINDALRPSGHLFLWMDKFILVEGAWRKWTEDTSLVPVDLVTWNKGRIGMGYRTRRASEHILVLQKKPKRAKGVWMEHNIPDVWEERAELRGKHPHAKPVGLQARLIDAVCNDGDIVVDPAAGSYSVLVACNFVRADNLADKQNIVFWGTDILNEPY